MTSLSTAHGKLSYATDCLPRMIQQNKYVPYSGATHRQEDGQDTQDTCPVLGQKQNPLSGKCPVCPDEWLFFSYGLCFLFSFKKRFYLFIFTQKGRVGEREGEKHQCVVASHVAPLGTWPATQACALSRNQSRNPLVHRPVLNQLSCTSQGWLMFS